MSAPLNLQRNTLIGLCASLLLAVGKFVAGWLGNSTALVADAVESLADSVGSLIVLKGLRLAHRPPDALHPYGYGRAEALTSLAVGGLLVIAAVMIVLHAFRELLVPHGPPEGWTLGVLLTVVVVKEGLFRLLFRGAQQHDSASARADAWHHRADAITSLAAIVGVSVAIWGPGWFAFPQLVLADEVAAILASGIILYTAWGLVQLPLRELLDADAPALGEEIREAASAMEGVRWVEKVFVRKSGPSWLVDMHLHVDPRMDIRSAHAVAGRVKAGLKVRFPALRHVLIHVEPDERESEGDRPADGPGSSVS